MNINKCIYKSKQLSKSIEDAIKNDIETISKNLLCKFDIKFRGSNDLVSLEELQDYIFSPFRQEIAEQDFCCAVTTQGKRCTKRQQHNSIYCKTHAFKAVLDNHSKIITTTTKKEYHQNVLVLLDQPGDKNHTNDKNAGNFKHKQFIDDTFYMIDDAYIYDCNSMQKVGYIERDGVNQPKYVLTDDPFVLEVA